VSNDIRMTGVACAWPAAVRSRSKRVVDASRFTAWYVTILPRVARTTRLGVLNNPGEARSFRRPWQRPYTVGMTFRVVLEHDPETGDYSAVCPELPGCASAGETEDEARANIREAIELYLAPGDIELPENAKLAEVTIG